VAGNGLEALAALRRQRYDVVLMDVQMPEMDGLEAARRIRREWPGADRPRVIALTANAMQEDRELCREAGMDDYLAKPVRGPQLQEALVRSVRLAAGRRQSGESLLARDAGSSLPDRPAEDGSGLVDAQALAELRQTTTPELVQELCRQLLASAPTLLAAMATAAAEGNASQLRSSAHSLKGAAAMLGARALAATCARLEEKGRAGTVEGAGPLLDVAERQLQRTAIALKEPTASVGGG
jgi:CheY-like chemotaxis protein